MNRIFGFRLSGAMPLAAVVLSLACMTPTTASAQSATTVNGEEIPSDVATLFIEARTQKPATDATAAERTEAMSQLTDIYLLTTQPIAKQLAEQPRTKAQIELQRRAILAQAVATDFLARNAATDEEILAEYNAQMKASPPAEYKARHILVETQAEAIDLIKELDGGADFAELAKANSTGPSGPNGGDLGWFGANQMVAPFSQAVMRLENGSYTKAPVQTQFGWHVILREDSRESTPPTLESVRNVVKQQIEQKKLQDYIAQLRETQQ